MIRFIGFGFFLFLILVGWKVSENLSSDAVSMAVGLLLGVMAGVPTALLVLASRRRRDEYDAYHNPYRRRQTLQEGRRRPEGSQHIHLHYHGAQNLERDATAHIEDSRRWIEER